MDERITVTGIVATDPRHVVTQDGLAITSFRLAAQQRRYDRERSRWVSGETHWYSVSAFRRLALNCEQSLNKGDRIVVAGRLRFRQWQSDAGGGTNAEIDAAAIGHDLSWGTSAFSRVLTAPEGSGPVPVPAPAPSPESGHDRSGSGGDRALDWSA
ncbi:single-stranded DNA-binding protein [Mycetocola reblochoni]|uniref:Single-stranded DNA-binding protein n=2 Tax=Mycetocola reblochoni TaxID=331618 RepID=A0A1R4JCY8_9MICO|nr:single-stranded DNA-binding protein [Mycetocola reblochoni]RLP69953.1 single-stranded DNA-binding protein [Mycetocola reblochoni]SJN29896.1 single-strand binding protein [Mycetocola reblochoni REB411]